MKIKGLIKSDAFVSQYVNGLRPNTLKIILILSGPFFYFKGFSLIYFKMNCKAKVKNSVMFEILMFIAMQEILCIMNFFISQKKNW